MEEKYILVSLEDEKAKKLANIVSNDTCRKLLDYLSNKDGSETDIAKALNLPLSTVHYNIQNLVENNLVEVKDFLWSDKGNKINIYRVAKKFIIISPKGEKIKESLKNLLPITIISLIAAGLIQMLYKTNQVDVVNEKAAEAAIASSLAASAPVVVNVNYGLWFAYGAIFAIVLYIIFNYIRGK